jgi:hypothetical protein
LSGIIQRQGIAASPGCNLGVASGDSLVKAVPNLSHLGVQLTGFQNRMWYTVRVECSGGMR